MICLKCHKVCWSWLPLRSQALSPLGVYWIHKSQRWDKDANLPCASPSFAQMLREEAFPQNASDFQELPKPWGQGLLGAALGRKVWRVRTGPLFKLLLCLSLVCPLSAQLLPRHQKGDHSTPFGGHASRIFSPPCYINNRALLKCGYLLVVSFKVNF